MTMPRPGPTTTYEAIDLAAAPRATGERAQQEGVAPSRDARRAGRSDRLSCSFWVWASLSGAPSFGCCSAEASIEFDGTSRQFLYRSPEIDSRATAQRSGDIATRSIFLGFG